jgi:hypothetical protein
VIDLNVLQLLYIIFMFRFRRVFCAHVCNM